MTNEPQSASSAETSVEDRLRRFDRVALLAGGGVLAAVFALIALVLTLGGTYEGPAPALQVTPAGADAPRLGPIVVTFPEAPETREGADLVSLEPATTGTFAWLDDRTLLFQPEFPGLLRGKEYQVRVASEAAGGEEDFVQTFTVEGKLEVRSVIPAPDDGDVPSEARIFVQFSRAVAPLTLLSEASTAPVVQFDPPLAGQGEWLNTSLYTFTPEDLRPSTTYRATVAAGLTSAADGVLDADFTWTFSTFQPALASSTPADDTSFVPRDSTVELVFNQPMAPAASEGVRLTTTDGAPVATTASWSEDVRTLTLTPAASLDLSTQYGVTVDAGLPGAAGGETRQSRSIEFRTVDPPRVVATSPRDGDTRGSRYGISVEFNNPMDIETLQDAVSVSGIDREDWTLYAYEQSLNINVRLEPSTQYTVSIGDGVLDRSGQPLPPYSFTFTTGALEPGVFFATPGGFGTYGAGVEQELLIWATNVDDVHLTLHELTEDQAKGYFAGTLRTETINNPIREWSLEVDGDENTSTLLSTPLGEGGPLPPGHYFVERDSVVWGSSFFFSVVDTTLVTKLALDELLVWAVDYETGEPVANLELTVDGPGAAGEVIRTDAEGIATLPVPRPSEVLNRDRSYTVTSRDAGRFAVTHTNLQAETDDWLLGVPVTYWDQPVVAHVYTDRPIYRSGETVEFKAVVRDDHDATYTLPEAGETDLQLMVMDARGKELSREPVVLNEFGTFAMSLTLPEEAATGYYNVAVIQRMTGGGENWIATTAFQVAEFRTPEFRVEMTPRDPELVDGETATIDLEASYFFGGPLAGVEVQWSAFASPTGVSFEGFERYSFTDFDVFDSSIVDQPDRGSGTATTGDDGFATIEVPAALRAGESTTQFQVSGTVLDQSGQAIGATASVTVHPSTVYAGMTAEDYVAQSGQPTDLLVAAVDIDGQPVANQSVTVEIVQREWSTVLEETSSGARRYVSTPRDTVLETRSVTSGADGLATLSYTPDRSGYLRLVARTSDSQGRVAQGASSLWVAGSGRAAWRVDNDSIIELVADADGYRVGDTAGVLIPAPYEDSQALITIERGGILHREIRFLDSNSTVVEVPIEEGHVPNVFVSVVLYRAPTAEDPVPRYHIGSVELPVSTETRELTVDLQSSVEQAQPGQTVSYDVTVTDSTGAPVEAEVSVAMVDAAVLSLSDFVDQNGLQAFWYERGLGVRTASSATVSVERNNDTVSEPDAGGKGGGGPEADSLRTQFRNTAYWEPQLQTDAQGHASFEVTLPDNLTTWRTQVRAVSGDTMVGESTVELLSTTPLLVRPALPRFLRVGDDVVLRTLVRNATDEPQEVTVTITADGVDLEGSDTQTQVVEPGASGDFAWDARANTEGTATVSFAAEAGDLADGVQLELPVYLDVTPETTATGGVVERESAVEAIYLPEYAITDRGSLEVKVQASIVGALESELFHLRPPLRREQESSVGTASRVIATIAARQAEGREGQDVYATVEDDLRRLQSIQRGDGGWGWCPVRCQTDPVVTGWVLMAFGDAVDAGWDSPDVQWRQGTSAIARYMGRTSDVADPIDPNEEALLLYASQQARGGDGVLQNTLRSLYEQHREELTPWGQAYLLLALLDASVTPDDAMVRGLMSDLNASVIPSANGNHWEADPIYGTLESNVSMTALVMRALAAADPEHPLVEETARWLVAARNANGWESGVERAQAIAGLGAYAALTGERLGDFDFRVLLDQDEVLAGHLAAGRVEEDSNAATDLPLGPITRGEVHRLAFERETGAGRLYYVLNLRYVTPAAEVESLSRGLSVAHEYTLVDDPDAPITEARLGDLVRVKLTIVADADRKFVEVEDLLPAGLEALDTQLATVPEDIRRQLEEERTDAILGEDAEVRAYAPWYRWYWSPWDDTAVRDDRFTLFATDLPRGVHEYVYFARATTLGEFFVAPATAQEGPFPEVFGRSDSGRFSVVR